VVDAVECAVEIQMELKARNEDLPKERRMEFRIGINLGDVIEQGERIYGDGVNIAARMEGLADGGGICISRTTYDQVKNKISFGYEYLGEQTVKNIKDPVGVYRILMDADTVGSLIYKRRKDDPKHRLRAALISLLILIIAVAAFGVWKNLLKPDGEPASIEKAAYPLPKKPSIAVLPFENMGGDPEQDYFADGMTEDLITDLSKISGLFVIARNSVFTYKGKPVNIRQVGHELGVRYVLEGSVRKAGDRVRINAQLIDALTGGHLWAERYDRLLKDIFTLQDEVTRNIVVSLALKLTDGERARIERKTSYNLEAYDYFLRAVDYYWRFSMETNVQARSLLKKAIEIDSMLPNAYVKLGWTYLNDWIMGWNQDLMSLDQAIMSAQKALSLENTNSEAHCLLANIYLFQKKYDQAIETYRKAIDLNPNYADAISGLGDIFTWTGKPEEAIEFINKAIRLNPSAPSIYQYQLGHAYLMAQRYEEAVKAIKEALRKNPDFLPSRLVLAAAYIRLNLLEKARAQGEEIMKRSPETSLEVLRRNLPYKDPEVLEVALDALRRAGLK
jgi:adenylate cyclase